MRWKRAAQNTRQTEKRVASADAAAIMWAVADYLAIGAEHGLLQANRVHIRFVRPGIHDTTPLVINFTFRDEDHLICTLYVSPQPPPTLRPVQKLSRCYYRKKKWKKLVKSEQ
jgi:hypothetical protein